MGKFTKISLVGILLVLNFSAFSQQRLYIMLGDSVLCSKKTKDSAQAVEFLHKFLDKTKAKGFSGSSIDSILYKADSIIAYLYLGSKFIVDTFFIIKNPDTSILPLNKPLSAKTVDAVINRALTDLRNSGYPLARPAFYKSGQPRSAPLSAKICGKKIQRNQVHINLYFSFETGRHFVFDTLQILDSPKISRKLLSTYLGIKPGQPYNKAAVDDIPEKIRQLSVISLNGKPKQEFYQGIVKVVLPLQNVPSNSLDALVGFRIENNRISSTGKINLRLKNITGNSETFELMWQKPKTDWQQTALRLEVPYIGGFPLGTNFYLNAQKIDTLDFNLTFSAQAAYFFDKLNNLTFGYRLENNKTNRTGVPDIGKTYATFGANIQNLDNQLFPRKGYVLKAGINYGQKRWQDSTSQTLNLSAYVRWLAQVAKKTTVGLSGDFFTIKSPEIYPTEVAYIGGYPQLTGFEPQQFGVTSYGIFTGQISYILTNAEFFALIQRGFLENITTADNQEIRTLSGGAGLKLKTKNSLLTIVFSLGKTGAEAFDPRQTKIRIGYRILF